jgi:hypothetical protein
MLLESKPDDVSATVLNGGESTKLIDVDGAQERAPLGAANDAAPSVSASNSLNALGGTSDRCELP